MNNIKRVTAAMMAALVIMTTSYNIYTVSVHAAGMTITGYLLGDLLVEALLGACAVYLGKETIDRVDLRNSMTSFLETPEGYAAVMALNVKAVNGKILNVGERVGTGSPSSNKPDILGIIASVAVAGICIDSAYNYFLQLFFDYVTDSETETAVGAAINNASNQEITYLPFPENFIFSSVDDPIYNDQFIEYIQSKYVDFSVSGNTFIEVYAPSSSDNIFIIPTNSNTYINFRIDRQTLYYSASSVNDSGIVSSLSGVNYLRQFQDNYFRRIVRSSSYAFYSESVLVYACGNVHFDYDDASYVLSPDGTIYQVVDGVASAQVKPHLETAEGYLTSVKSIVNMDISSLIDAIGKAIVASYPDEAPVLTQEAINQIYENTSNYYDQAVSNYYNDTSYLTQNDYITNITNIYEQAIADNPAVDVPVTDTGILSGIKALPGQIVEGIKGLIIPDTAVLSGYMVSLLGHFGWLQEPWDFFKDLIDLIFVDHDPPVIYIDFSMAESSYNYGGKTVLIDFAFWQPYKPVADAVIVGFCYIWFALWLFRNLPEIIRGSSPVPVWRAAERAQRVEQVRSKENSNSE